MNSGDGLTHQSIMVRPATHVDLRDVVSIRQAQELADSGAVFTTAERLGNEWEALGDRLAERVWVAVDEDNCILTCAELLRVDGVFMIRLWSPDHQDVGIAQALLAKAEERVCAIGREENADSVTLFSQATSSYFKIQRALTQADFTLLSTYEKMELALNELPAPPANIPGIEIQAFAQEQSAEAVYRADEEAFLDQRGHTPRTFEQWKRRLNFDEETFDPSVWLIAWDVTEIVGAALGEVVEGIGWVHHLFVRQPWRRHGLGAALMLSILRAFHGQGVGAARLNVDAQSLTNAHQLYRRLGYRVTGTYSNFEKIVPLA